MSMQSSAGNNHSAQIFITKDQKLAFLSNDSCDPGPDLFTEFKGSGKLKSNQVQEVAGGRRREGWQVLVYRRF
jgi:hypothetical protein